MDLGLIILIVAWLFVLVWVPIIIYNNRKLHPRALFILFFAEMWERFSYYGMRTLLILYMVKVLFAEMGSADADSTALGIYGSYTAMVYLFPVIGGIIADKILGFRKAIIFGGILMMAGHFALALEGMYFAGNMQLFFLSLAFIIIGNGFFKPNISSLLGNYYGADDSRKDGAFTIFYMGVNIGALLSTVTCGYIGEQISWHYGFGLAGIGMMLGLIVFWFAGDKYLGKKGINPSSMEDFPEINEQEDIALLSGPKEVRELARQKEAKNFTKFMDSKLRRNQLLTYIATLIFIPISAQFLKLSDILTWILVIMSLGVLCYLFIMAQREDTVEKRQRLKVVVVLFLFHSMFWALFEQAGGSLTLFTARNIDRVIAGSEVPASIFQFLNAFFIMVLAPVFSIMWIKLRNKGKEPSTPMKFVLGLSQLALGFGVLVIGAKFFSSEGLVPVIFIVLTYLFHTTGELSLSPVGLSMITKLSPKKAVGFVMGAWFLSIALANKMAGLIGELTAVDHGGNGDAAPILETLTIYSDTYLLWGVVVVGVAAMLLFTLVPTLKKWMHGIH
ncbi:MAG: peptide MFS transporter [Candidatus Kapaibacterium sp.]|nr:peptide MFS transporter [Ignavibacteriota bacterium]